MARRRSQRSDGHDGTSLASEPDPTFVFTLPQRARERNQLQNHIPPPDHDLYETQDDGDDDDDNHDSGALASAPPAFDRLSSLGEAAISGNASVVPDRTKRTSRVLHTSRHGLKYPSFPAAVAKRLATSCARTVGAGKLRLNAESVQALVQASDQFFEQLADDLASYAQHAGRKKIDEADVVTLMKRCVQAALSCRNSFSKRRMWTCIRYQVCATCISLLTHWRRQRQLSQNKTPFSLAQKTLPRELLQMIGAPPSRKRKATPRQRLLKVDEELNEDE